jgi:hypothetical protein
MRAIGLVCAVLFAVLAGAAWPGSTTRTYTTGQFVVNCTSAGQVCSPAKKLTLTPPRGGTVTSVRYTTSPQHCSALVLQVVRGGKVVATSGRIEAGEQTEHFNPHISVPKGLSKLGFRAKGFVGGCNTGRVGSWGGKVTVTVTLKRR